MDKVIFDIQPIQNNMCVHRYFQESSLFSRNKVIIKSRPQRYLLKIAISSFTESRHFTSKSSNKKLQKINEFIRWVLQINLLLSHNTEFPQPPQVAMEFVLVYHSFQYKFPPRNNGYFCQDNGYFYYLDGDDALFPFYTNSYVK